MTVALEPGRAYVLEAIRDVAARKAAAAPQIAAWLRWCEGRDLRPNTVLAYEKRTRPLLRMYPSTQLEDFTAAELEAFMSTVPRMSRRPTLTALVSLFRQWALARDMIDKDPTKLLGEMRPPKQKNVKTFSEAEEAALTGLPGEDGLRMLLMFDTGLRIGELSRLRVRDVQVTRGQIVVLDGKGGKDRVVPITGRLVQAFQEWAFLEAVKPGDCVFGHRKPGGHEGVHSRRDPLSEDAIRKWFYQKLEEAGVDRDERTPHCTRHTYATTLLRRNASSAKVAKILGHKHSSTTEEIYGHLVVEDLRDVVALLEA